MKNLSWKLSGNREIVAESGGYIFCGILDNNDHWLLLKSPKKRRCEAYQSRGMDDMLGAYASLKEMIDAAEIAAETGPEPTEEGN